LSTDKSFLEKEKAQELCDSWARLLKIGSWKFTVELCDSIICHESDAKNIKSQFRYNCQDGTAVLEILYKAATEKEIVSMLVDFSLIHKLLPRLDESGEQYLDHDDRNIKPIVNALIKLKNTEKQI